MKDNLLNILGVETNENVWSNIYAYLFNPWETHGRSYKFMRAFVKLLQSRNNSIPDFKNYTIQREVKVNENREGRIDLLIRDGHNYLIIENKVYHNADGNPFRDYFDSIKDSDASKFIVLLTLHRSEYLLKDLSKEHHIDPKHLVNITHYELTELFTPIVKTITNVKVNYLLEDFISIIENRSYSMNNIYEFLTHRDKINRYVEIARTTKEYLYNTLSDKYFVKEINTRLTGNLKGLEEVNSDWKPIRELRRYIRFKFSCSNELILGISLESIWKAVDNEPPMLIITLQPDGKWFEIAKNKEKKIRELIGNHSKLYCNPIDDRGWWLCAEIGCKLRNDEITDPTVLQEKAIALISDTENGFLQVAEQLFNLLDGTNIAD